MKSNIELFFSGDPYYLRILEELAKAQSEILFESYIFEVDEIGLTIMQALGRARQRGVSVKVLVDGIGSSQSQAMLKKQCAEIGIQFRVYHPLPFQIQTWSHFKWRTGFRWLRFFRRINKRDHRKMVIIDQKQVFLGSFNISKVHSARLNGKNAWRDTGVHVDFSPAESTEELQILIEAFTESWRSARFFRRTHFRAFRKSKFDFKDRTHRLFRLNSRPLWRFLLQRELIKRIRQAKDRIYITNAYFLPRKRLLRGLRDAGMRGVDVRLLIPQKTDAWIVREAARSLYWRLLSANVKIFEYQNHVLHAKTLIIDDWATVGSHNLNHRSFMHDLEVETMIEDPKLIDQLLAQWHQDMRHANPVTLLQFNETIWLRRWVSQFFYWFRYWM